MIRIRDIKLPVGHTAGDLLDETAKILCLDSVFPNASICDLSYEILRKSIDARKKPAIFFVYTVKVLISDKDEKKILAYLSKNSKRPKVRKCLDRIVTDPLVEYEIPMCGDRLLIKPPVVVGSGPAGLFSALLLARRGFKPVVIERGKRVDQRKKCVDEFWKTGKLDKDSNVQFGEGGAGTFSDGKLNTLTKDTGGRNSFVIRTFFEHGANADILVDAKPHIGTDVLTDVVSDIRNEILSLGGCFLYDTLMSGITVDDKGVLSGVEITDVLSGDTTTIETSVCVLAIGHSARDTFEMLYDKGIRMTQKSFAMGFRVIHPQELADRWAYGKRRDEDLPPADYKVAYETKSGRRVYSFCMCPGGYVVNASSEPGRLCVNGMSLQARGGPFANSAIIAAITPDDFIQDEVPPDHPLAGMYHQRRIEEEAYKRGEGSIPLQSFDDFEAGRTDGADLGGMGSAVKGMTSKASLRGIFTDEIDEAVIESMHKFGYTMEDFDKKAVLLGVEARTSSPIRILRDENFNASLKGLYPCGEGAGYAGGITSAAADGIRVAEQIIKTYHMEADRG